MNNGFHFSDYYSVLRTSNEAQRLSWWAQQIRLLPKHAKNRIFTHLVNFFKPSKTHPPPRPPAQHSNPKGPLATSLLLDTVIQSGHALFQNLPIQDLVITHNADSAACTTQISSNPSCYRNSVLVIPSQVISHSTLARMDQTTAQHLSINFLPCCGFNEQWTGEENMALVLHSDVLVCHSRDICAAYLTLMWQSIMKIRLRTCHQDTLYNRDLRNFEGRDLSLSISISSNLSWPMRKLYHMETVFHQLHFHKVDDFHIQLTSRVVTFLLHPDQIR